MSEFQCPKWDNVIVNWVNCLRISKEIRCIADLKDGQFLQNVLEIIHPDLETKLKDLLSAHYPNLPIPASLDKYSNNDFVIVASLLLHYLCLYDRRDSMINPLCTQLNRNEQLYIKCFLENFPSTADAQEFKEIITSAIQSDSRVLPSTPNKSLEWSLDSQQQQNSPLLEYFKTPARSGKLQKKDREIKRLEKELALERYEKDDLYAEINEQKGRIQKITQDLQERSTLITKLSIRLSELEETSSVDRPQEVIDIEKLLRQELSDSQLYINSLRKLQDETLTRNEEISKKLSHCEGTANVWQERAVNFETQFDEMSIKYKVQEQEMRNLRMNYNEMQALLEELRENKKNISCSELETESFSEADRAATVIDIQLKECHSVISDMTEEAVHMQNVNFELDLSLKQQKEESQKLEVSLKNAKMQYNAVQQSLNDSQTHNDELQMLIAQASMSNNALSAKNKEMSISLQNLSIASGLKDEQIDRLQLQLEQRNVLILDNEITVHNLNQELANLRVVNKELAETMQNKNKFVQKLETECLSLQQKYETSLEKYTETNFAFEAIKTEYQRSEQSFQTQIARLEQIVCGSIEHANEEKTTRFSRILQQLTTKQKSFESTIDLSKKLNEELEKQIISLQENENNNARKIEFLQSSLAETKAIIKAFEVEIQMKNAEIEKSRVSLLETNEIIQHFEEMKIANEKSVQNLNEELILTKDSLSNHSNLNSQLQNELKASELSLQSVKSENEKLLNNNCLLQNEVQKIEQLFDVKTNEYTKSQEQLNEKSAECVVLLRKITDLTERFAESEIAHVTTMSAKETHIEQLNSNVGKLENENKQISNELQTINGKYKDCNEEMMNMRLNIVSLNDEMNDHKRSIQELISEIDVQLVKVRDKDAELAEMKQLSSSKDLKQKRAVNKLNAKIEELEEHKAGLCDELCLIKDTLAAKQAESQTMLQSKEATEKQLSEKLQRRDQKINILNLTIHNLEENIKNIESEKICVQKTLSETINEVEMIKTEKLGILHQCEKLQIDVSNVTKALEIKERECEDHDQVVQKSNQELCALRLEMTIKQGEIFNLNETIEKFLKQESEKNDEINVLTTELQALQLKIDITAEELRSIEEIKVELSNKIESYESKVMIVLNHFEINDQNLQSSLDSLMNFKTEKDAQICTLNAQIKTLEEDAKRARNDEVSMKKELTLKITEQTNCVEQLENERDELKIIEVNCLLEIERLKDELSSTVQQYMHDLQKQKDTKMDNEAQIRSLTENVHEMLAKYNQLDKKYKDALEKLDVNVKTVATLQSEKDALEVNIVQLKCEFDRDIDFCKQEYDLELSSLREEIAALKTTLVESSQTEFRLENELIDAKSQLQVLQSEQSELEIKLQALETIYKDVQQDYNNLEIANEEYMKQSQSQLKRTKDALETEICTLKALIDDKDCEQNNLNKQLVEVTNLLHKEEAIFLAKHTDFQVQVQLLHDEIANYQRNIDTLNTEKAAMEKKLENLQNDNKKITELEEKSRLLQISKDVLEAGVFKLERLNENLQQELSDCHCKSIQAEKEHIATKSALIKQLNRAQEKLDSNAKQIKEKNMLIAAANDEFDTVQVILTEMSKRMDCSTRELSEIHENYEGKLKTELNAFAVLRDQFHSTNKDLRIMSALNSELKIELQHARDEREDVAELLSEKEKLISELRTKYDDLARLVDDKDACIASLQAELAVGIEQLEIAARHKIDVEERHEAAKRELELVVQRKEALQEHLERENEEKFKLLRMKTEELLNKLRNKEETIVDVEKLLKVECRAKQYLETRVEDLETLLHDAKAVNKKLCTNLRTFAGLVYEKENEGEEEVVLEKMEERIVDIFSRLRSLSDARDVAMREKDCAEMTLAALSKHNDELREEKSQLLEAHEKLKLEKQTLSTKNVAEIETLRDDLQRQHLSGKLLEQKIEELEEANLVKNGKYLTFIQHTQCMFRDIDEMTRERNQIDQIVSGLQENFVTMQMKSSFIVEERYKLHYEQKMTVEIITNDIYKQFRRLSKMIYNFNLKCHAEVEQAIKAIVEEKSIVWQTIYKELNAEDIIEKLDDLKANAANALEQMKAFIGTVEELAGKSEKAKVLKENVCQTLKDRDDDWKKKYSIVKQKLTLTENAKNNFERKLRELRDERKNLVVKKESSAAQLEIDELKKRIDSAASSYSELSSNYSRVEEENAQLQNAIKAMQSEAASKSQTQLFEENSKLQSEIDTIKYKRTRDREEFVKQIKQNEAEFNAQMQTIRSDYDMKIEKFKTKIMSKYREQVEQSESNSIDKLASLKEESQHYKMTISKLRDELAVAQAKVDILDSEKHLALQQLRQKESEFKAPAKMARPLSAQSDFSFDAEQRRATLATFRRNAESINVIEEVRYRRTSITPSTASANDLRMEDEDEMFNTKYLHELKSGGRNRMLEPADSSNSRLTEFAYRNSLCPPHLKSSYPAETQFLDSQRFKEDDLRSGNLHLDDSMKTHLLPQEKPKKKDVGTTSYKRPGPPTPSKHGARSSLLGNERAGREVLQIEQKKTTPNRLRSLFSRSKDSSSENATSPKKRPTFFRR